MNRVRKETVAIRNKTIADLKRIYAAQWDEISEEFERLVNQMTLEDLKATQTARLKHADNNGKGELVALITGAAVLANTRAIKRINSGMAKIYTLNADDVASYAFKKSGKEIFTKEVTIQSLLGKHTKKRYNQASDSKYVSRQVVREIDRMLKQGVGTKKISQRLNKVYNFNRTSAFRTTLTETTRIQSRGRFDTMNEAKKKGLVFKKIWKHGVFIKKPRDWHVDMAGEVRDLDEPFSNGLMMPGEDNAPAEEVINCHCYLDEELVDW